jgi:HSP20 family protein
VRIGQHEGCRAGGVGKTCRGLDTPERSCYSGISSAGTGLLIEAEKEVLVMVTRLPNRMQERAFPGFGLSNLIDDLFRDFDRIGFETPTAFGRTDVYEKDQKLVYETELPGMKKTDIEVKIEEERLIISGELQRDESIDRQNYFRMGRRYGRFQRSYPIPMEQLDTSKVRAQFEDGILRVSIPLRESIAQRRKPLEVKID